MLSYPSAIDVSTHTLNHLTDLLRAHQREQGSRWRRLPPERQALLVLAHLRNGDSFPRLAAGFQIGIATAWRYVQEGLAVLAAAADDLTTAMKRISQLAYAIVDGTLIPTNRVHHEKPYYSGKHHRHGVNIQVVTDPLGRLVWLSPALPGKVHDLTAFRTHGLDTALTDAGVLTFLDKAYQGLQSIRATGQGLWPAFRANRYHPLSDGQKLFNRGHASIRAHGERANAVIKCWHILDKLRCCPRKATTITQAILVLQHIEKPR